MTENGLSREAHVQDQRPEAETVPPSVVQRFDESIAGTLRRAVRLSLRSPRLALFALRAARSQRRMREIRAAHHDRGLHVPPFMILSVTNRCNLKCAGCYARASAAAEADRGGRPPAATEAGEAADRSGASARREMTAEQVGSVIGQAHDLGVGVVLVAGGEPLLRPELLSIGAEFPDMIFLLFTNGLLVTDSIVRRFRSSPNVVPVISIEGHAEPTDGRRGQGTFAAALRAMALLTRAGVFFGTSITLTTENYLEVTGRSFVESIRRSGCRHFIYVEYVPVEQGSERLALDEAARVLTAGRIETLRRSVRALFTAFPGGEEEFGGCLAAGRGFIHVSATGALEPCPFAPFSDSSLCDMTLEEGLRSPLLRAIREADGALRDTTGGCALFAHRDWVTALARDRAERAPLP